MATKSSRLKQGDEVRITAGEFASRTAVVVDPKPFPDTDHRRRKITVDVSVDDDTIERIYILPRLIEPVVTVGSVPITVPTLVEVDGPIGGRALVPGDITDLDDPRLDPWRPSPEIVKSYVSRVMCNGQKDVNFLLRFWQKRENVLLVGDTQSGKTLLVQVLAVLAGLQRPSQKPLPVFTLSGSSGVTDFDLFGQPVPWTGTDGRDRLVTLPGVVTLAARAGGILYLDELNMMSERVTASLHSLCDHRRAFVNRQKAVVIQHEGSEVFLPEIVEAHPDLWIVATINPAVYGGTGKMNEAFTNRWTHIPWGYDENTEKKLIPSAAIRLLGQALREARANRAITTPIGTAALIRLSEHVRDFGVDAALWMLEGMFLPQEQAKVRAILTDRSIAMLLRDEQQASAPAAPL